MEYWEIIAGGVGVLIVVITAMLKFIISGVEELNGDPDERN